MIVVGATKDLAGRDAYILRRCYGYLWREIGATLGADSSGQWATSQARRFARARGLPWPISPLPEESRPDRATLVVTK